MAERLALGEYDQLHHFIAAGVWDAAPVETELLVQADRLVGGVGRNPARTARSLSFAPADGRGVDTMGPRRPEQVLAWHSGNGPATVGFWWVRAVPTLASL